MNTTTVAVDLAKDVFQLVAADSQWRVTQMARLCRSPFAAWFENCAVDQVAREIEPCKLLLSISGVGLLTSTATVASTSGKVTRFKVAPHFASWFGLTLKEYSSAVTGTWGGFQKKGIATCACCSPTARGAFCAAPW